MSAHMSERDIDDWEPPAPKVIATLKTISAADRATLIHAAELLEREARALDGGPLESIFAARVADFRATARALREMAG